MKYQPRMKVWRLKEGTVKEALRERMSMVEDDVFEVERGWMSMKDSLLGVGEICGWKKGPPRHVEIWWWDDKVGKKIEKRKKFKKWQKAKGTMAEDAVYESYKAAKKAAKKEEAKAKEAQRKTLGERLDSEEGQRAVFRIEKQITKERCDVTGVSCLKDEVGQIVVDPDGIKGRWKRQV